MANKQESNWNLDQLSDTEIYAAIRDLDPDPGSANKQLPQLTDGEIYAAIGYLDPDPASANEQDPRAWSSNPAELMAEGLARLHTAVLVIWFSLVILLGFVWFLLARNALL